MPSEMRRGWRYRAEGLRMINLRGAAPYVAVALGFVVVVIVVGAVFAG